MLKIVRLLFLLLLAAPAWAANAPVITAPAGAFVLPSTATVLDGLSISETGAGPTEKFTLSLTATRAVMSATGTNITGSGTTTLAIGPDTTAQMTTALGTLTVKLATAALLDNDTIGVNLTDNTNSLTATPVSIAITADGNKYLVFGTLAAAQARSQTQCAALGCDGVHTIYWWDVEPTTSGGGAVRVQPADPCYDYHVPPTAVPVTICSALGLAHATNGLTTSEQSQLVTAPNAGLVLPSP
jgi:hypothetical protein